MNPNDIFSTFFGGSNPFFDMMNGGFSHPSFDRVPSSTPRRGRVAPISVVVEATLTDLYLGCEKEVSFSRQTLFVFSLLSLPLLHCFLFSLSSLGATFVMGQGLSQVPAHLIVVLVRGGGVRLLLLLFFCLFFFRCGSIWVYTEHQHN